MVDKKREYESSIGMNVGLVKDAYAKVCWPDVVTILNFTSIFCWYLTSSLLRTDMKMTCVTMRLDNVIKIQTPF